MGYTGPILTSEQANNSNSHYLLQLAKNKIIDSENNLEPGYGRFVNDCTVACRKAGYCKGNNAKFSVNQRKNIGLLKASKPIKNNSEIFVNYSKGYWRKHGVP